MEASENLLNVIYVDESLEDYHDADMLDSETLEEGECRTKIGSLQLTETSKLTEMGSRGDVTVNQASNSKTRKRRAKKKNKNTKAGPAAAIKNMSKFVIDTCKRLKERKNLSGLECCGYLWCPCSERYCQQ
ncbi:hypothetical protein MKW92_002025, partial [Papaver armeniacum]